MAYASQMNESCRGTLWERILEYFGFITDKTVYNLLRRIYMDVVEIKQKLDNANSMIAEAVSIIPNISGDVDSLLDQIAALTQEILNGKVATQEDLDAIGAKATTLQEGLASMKDALTVVDNKEPAQP